MNSGMLVMFFKVIENMLKNRDYFEKIYILCQLTIFINIDSTTNQKFLLQVNYIFINAENQNHVYIFFSLWGWTVAYI